MTARYRIGQGFDAHRFRAGRSLRLCGHTIEGEVGLEGHSDADVGLHAVTDALLGAIAGGDIGEVFPPSDPRWRDADSSLFVARAVEMVVAAGYAVSNCDLTLIGERPRIAPHRAALRTSLSRLLGVSEDSVSVKATTTEGMGWAGRGEGLAAMAVILLSEVSADG
jgi:2-C-methyl-D-erythritol 4-phosphate cytidylyltransferase/2-C-methyl-D-erythritol 2,4-cyclodiphosphate synthase